MNAGNRNNAITLALMARRGLLGSFRASVPQKDAEAPVAPRSSGLLL